MASILTLQNVFEEDDFIEDTDILDGYFKVEDKEKAASCPCACPSNWAYVTYLKAFYGP